MLGLSGPQIACFVLGFVSTALAWWIARRGRIPTHRHIAYYLSAIMFADVIGVLIQQYVVKSTPYGSGTAIVQAARQFDTATYLGWPIALVILGAMVFDGGKVGKMVTVCAGATWLIMCTYLGVTYSALDESPTVIQAHRALVDHVFTIGHVLCVAVGFVLAVRFYANKRWPLLPHLTVTIFLLGALSDCAGQYAHAAPSVDYDLSSIVGILVYSFVNVAQGYTIFRIKRGAT
jgi:drug/metabolite transporter (DMT)-like permease